MHAKVNKVKAKSGKAYIYNLDLKANKSKADVSMSILK